MKEFHFAQSATFLTSAVYPKSYPETLLPEVAIAGRSNVGKSTLINGLVNRKKLAKVSNTPGRTQLLNFFLINNAFVLCDLPGYGYAKVPAEIRKNWRPMIETYLARREQLKLLMLLVDIRRDPGTFETDLIGWATAHGLAILPVATKLDKLSASKRKPALNRVAKGLGLESRSLFGWSALSGEGGEKLWRTLNRRLNLTESGD
ncbi:MAG: ribosome biogenesis GTP-binding protein YihA/YsxC [Bradymonadia bacterium]